MGLERSKFLATLFSGIRWSIMAIIISFHLWLELIICLMGLTSGLHDRPEGFAMAEQRLMSLVSSSSYFSPGSLSTTLNSPCIFDLAFELGNIFSLWMDRENLIKLSLLEKVIE
jgi:hypothetical protein